MGRGRQEGPRAGEEAQKKREKKIATLTDDFMVDDSDDSDVDNLLDFVDEADEGSSVMLLWPARRRKTAAVYAAPWSWGTRSSKSTHLGVSGRPSSPNSPRPRSRTS